MRVKSTIVFDVPVHLKETLSNNSPVLSLSITDTLTQSIQIGPREADDMALGIYIVHEGFTPEKYDEVIKQLNAAGAGSPKGRSSHFALESDGAIQVFDVWESQADFDAFGETLVPILTGQGIKLREPMVANVYNSITG